MNRNVLQINLEKITRLTSCDACVAVFDRILQEKKVIAFDAEWKPVYVKRLRPTLALFQIATSDQVYLLDVVELKGSFSENAANKLFQIMASERIRKLAFASDDDLELLGDLHPRLVGVAENTNAVWDFKVFRDNSFEFLQTLYPEIEMDGPNKLGFSLGALTKLVLGKVLSKPENIRCSDWSRRPLTVQQIKYAALDAHCLLMLNDALEAKAEEKCAKSELLLELDYTSSYYDSVREARLKSSAKARKWTRKITEDARRRCGQVEQPTSSSSSPLKGNDWCDEKR